ncbi:hypothetical protein [Stenotrophomonas sp. 364]|uniref:hypothetical protein n=1 Tax=Stenotrophomonas sp. 364 TaxID=2691571 RepID=UPI001317A1BD|nr:hypothetical protein [Stenotrophomonas sp. 364]QHB72504.1 hypothetical protein GQ674_14915 [Stenotrophomonas sp. 364]
MIISTPIHGHQVIPGLDQRLLTHAPTSRRDRFRSKGSGSKDRHDKIEALDSALSDVFASPGYERWATEPLLFWAPLLALCMGIRASEATRIAVEDVVECDGVACITLREGSNLHLEDLESTRRRRRFTKHSKIPVPQSLLDAGFMGYVTAVAQKGERQLFPCDGQRSADQRTAWLRTRFARHLRSIGIASGGLPELRRSYEKRLHIAEVRRDRIPELLRVGDPWAKFYKQFFFVSFSRSTLKGLMDKSAKGLLDLPRYPSK